MTMLNLRERRLTCHALLTLIEDSESLIEAHRVGWGRNSERVIPATFRKQVAIWERKIKAAKLLRAKIMADIDRGHPARK